MRSIFFFKIKNLLTIRFLFLALVFFAVLMNNAPLCTAQTVDSTGVEPPVVASPQTAVIDTISKDSIAVTTDNDFKSKVDYSADDSLYFDVENQVVYLYGNAVVKYENMTLKANYMEVNLGNKIMYSTFTKDSAGNRAGIPEFEQADDKFTADEIRYNFSSKKGRIKGVYSQQGDGYVHGETVKKIDDYEYIRNGLYTTCDLPHPHYGIAANKLKVINNKKIITGPAYLVIADVPTPLAIPFGYFPNRKGRASGIIFPTYGESNDLGFYLKNGGYYFGVADVADFAITGDIYSKGSWGAQFFSRYANRYHYTGNLSLSYSEIKNGESELPDFNFNKEFFVRWSHAQDAKARPNSVFSASVNAGSSQYYRIQVTSPNNYVTNTFQSSVSYSKTWTGKPYSFSASMSHSQNTQTRDISLSLPTANFSVQRLYPFQRKIAVGEQKWYEKIGVSYTANALNQIQTKDSLLFTADSKNKFKAGIQHSIPVSTSIKLFKFFTLTPSFNYNEKWYLKTINRRYDSENDSLITDTINGFKAARDFSTSASLNTRIYGMVNFKNSKIMAIRHVVSPTVSFSYRPDFSEPQWNYYKTVQTDAAGNESKYSIFETGVFGGPSSGKQGLVSFNLDNNLEMKVRKETDSSETTKKIKIFESLSFNSSYNIAADSLRWSNISMNARTTLFDKVNVNFGSSFDPYVVNENGIRINKSELKENNRLARLTNATLTFGYNFSHSAKNKTTTKGSDADRTNILGNPNEYVDLDVPFNFNMNYSFNYSKPGISEAVTTQVVNFNGDISLTPKWKFIFSSGYDFRQKQVSYTSLSFYRDLHCWEMRLNWVPLGSFTYYNFQINVKASVLQDLKWVKKNDPYDN